MVLAAAGSSDPAAMARSGSRQSCSRPSWACRSGPRTLSAAQPAVADAVRGLRAQTGGQVAVASYLLAPGQFHDQLAGSGADWVTAPLGGHPAVAGMVIDRYRTAARSN